MSCFLTFDNLSVILSVSASRYPSGVPPLVVPAVSYYLIKLFID